MATGAWEALTQGDAKAFDPAREAATTGVLSDIIFEPRTAGGKVHVEHVGRAFQGFSEFATELDLAQQDLTGGGGGEIKTVLELAPFAIGAKATKATKATGLKEKTKAEPAAEPAPEAPGKPIELEGKLLPKAEAPPEVAPAPEPPSPVKARAEEATRDGILPDDTAPDQAAMAAAREDAGIPPVGQTEAAAPTMVLDLRNASAVEHVAVAVERANENLVRTVADDISMNTAATAGKARAAAGEASPGPLAWLSSPSHLAAKTSKGRLYSLTGGRLGAPKGQQKFARLMPYVKAGTQARGSQELCPTHVWPVPCGGP